MRVGSQEGVNERESGRLFRKSSNVIVFIPFLSPLLLSFFLLLFLLSLSEDEAFELCLGLQTLLELKVSFSFALSLLMHIFWDMCPPPIKKGHMASAEVIEAQGTHS